MLFFISGLWLLMALYQFLIGDMAAGAAMLILSEIYNVKDKIKEAVDAAEKDK